MLRSPLYRLIEFYKFQVLNVIILFLKSIESKYDWKSIIDKQNNNYSNKKIRSSFHIFIDSLIKVWKYFIFEIIQTIVIFIHDLKNVNYLLIEFIKKKVIGFKFEVCLNWKTENEVKQWHVINNRNLWDVKNVTLNIWLWETKSFLHFQSNILITFFFE